MKIDTKIISFVMLAILLVLTVILSVFVVSAKTSEVHTATNSPDAQKNDYLQNFLAYSFRKNAEHIATKSPLGSSANITYAYVDLNQAGGDTASGTGAKIHVMANITLTSEFNLKYADAKVEFYGFHLYSEQGSIANLTYSLMVEKLSPYGSGSGYSDSPIRSSSANYVRFSDGTIIDVTEIIGDNFGGGGGGFNSYYYPNRTHIVIGAGTFITSSEAKQSQALTDFRNAQTLYIDVTRILGVTFQENANPMVTPTLFSDEVLCHVELIKVGDRFGYGAYTGDEYNYPVVDDPLPYDPLPDSFQNDMSFVYGLIAVLLLVCLFSFL